MQLQLMWKDSNSGKDGCPALYDTDDPAYYAVVGIETDGPNDLAAGLGEGERMVLVPRNVLDRLREEA